MRELADYSGELRPDLKMQDFSKDALVASWLEGGRMVYEVFGIWYSLMKQRFGDELGRELNDEAWAIFTGRKAQRAAKAMNITGNDVAAAFKCWQVDPAFNSLCYGNVEYNLKSEKHGIMTLRHCASLDYYERHNASPEEIKYMCHKVCIKDTVPLYTGVFNPKIAVRGLVVPPRKPGAKVACVTEFKLEE